MSADQFPQCQHLLNPDSQFCGVCGSPVSYEGDAPERFLGTLIANKFQVQEVIGIGSMGVVYLAEQLSLNKLIALKVLKRTLIYDHEALQRFHLEARAASRLDHPNSISIMDFGQCDDGSPFIAMEFVDGQDLAAVVNDEFPLAPGRIIRLMKQVCSALDEAHAAGIIHRDLKLANIMLSQRRTGEEFVKVLDFGIAKLVDPQAGQAPMTREGLVCGTPAFMSPEQVRGLQLDPRTDIYALGVILFVLLTGRLPFIEQSAAGMAAKILTENAPKPSKVRLDVDVHPVFDAIVAKAMSRDRNDRYASAQELSRALDSATAQINRSTFRGMPATSPLSAPQAPSGGPPQSPRPAADLPSTGAAMSTSIMSEDKRSSLFPQNEVTQLGSNTPNRSKNPRRHNQLDNAETELHRPEGIPSTEIRVSRTGSVAALVIVALLALGVATGAYFFLINADTAIETDKNATTVNPKEREERMVSLLKATGKASYHIKIGLVRAEDAARNHHSKLLLATTDTSQIPTNDTQPDSGTPDEDTPKKPDDPPADMNFAVDNANNSQAPKGLKGPRNGNNPRGKKTPDKPPKTTGPEPTKAPETPKVTEEPKKPQETPFQLGVASLNSNPAQALQHFKAAARQNPRNRAAWVHISRLALRLGQSGEAKRACLRVISLSRTKDAPRLTCEKLLKRSE